MTSPVQSLFDKAVQIVSSSVDGKVFETAKEIFPERLRNIERLLEILDQKRVLHRDQNGPIPTEEIRNWEEAWLSLADEARFFQGGTL